MILIAPRLRLWALASCVGLALCWSAAAQPRPQPEPQAQPVERTDFTDAEITDGFLRTTIGAEFQIAGRVDRIRKYEAPVRIFIDGGGSNRTAQLTRIVNDIARRIRHLDLAVVKNRDAANVTVALVRERDFYPTLTRFFGRDRAREIRQNLDPQCLSGFRKDDDYRILGSTVVLITDIPDFVFADCAYEELLQALGPINDTDNIPWTMFNDDVQKGYFDVYDQLLLNVLYDPRIKAGMTAREVEAVLPQILPDVRAFVAETNGLKK